MGDEFTIQRREAKHVDGGTHISDSEARFYPLLFEILRSFTTLAETLNLSHAVKALGSTRQTVRRHIAQLEEIKGGPLFRVTDRQYELTALGEKILPEAFDLQQRAQSWVEGRSRQVNGLQYLHLSLDNGWYFFQQQHAISQAFTSTSPFLREAMEAWAKSGGELESEHMLPVRDMLTVFRRSGDTWICVELGESSAFVSWFGWAAARSSIGRELGGLPGGTRFARMANLAYEEVERTHSVRLDHIFTPIPRESGDSLTPCCYERLLMASRFPDDSFALIQAVRRTHDVEIHGVNREMLRQMPDDLVM